MRRRPMRFLRRVGRGVSLGSRTTILCLSLGFAALPLLLAAPVSAEPSPTASYAITGIAGTNGWYRGSPGGDFVVLRWSIQDPGNVIVSTTGCEAAIKIDGPTTGTTRTCTALLTGGGSVSWTTNEIKIDADAPSGVNATAARSPDVNGWYNHPVAISWSGSDATSGIASCASLTYTGPDGAGAAVGGGCTDNAGNSTSVPLAINYDATAPVLSAVSVVSGAAADVVRWTSSSAADVAVVQRAARGNKEQPVFRGAGTRFVDSKISSGLEYTYSVQTYDQAGNASPTVSVAGLPKVLTLRKLPYVPRAATKPILRWDASRRASYYHVQLFRGSKRIFAAWPVRNELGLPAAWTWSGHRYRLGAGTYRWYVWAGIGRRSFARYKAIGSARFIVPRVPG